jgi:hypothetical protein
MRGIVPQMRLSCGLSKRTKAGNIINSLRRALKMRNCERAERIADSRDFYSVTQGCVSFATLARLHRLVRECYERA